MKRWSKSLNGWGALAVLYCATMSAKPARGQEQNPDTRPRPAAHAYPLLGDATGDDQPSPDAVLPDNRPLTGLQSATLGRIESPHSYWVPGVQYGNTIQNNLPGSTSSGWSITNYVAANVSLLESWRASQLAMNYSGGGTFSTDSTLGNGTFQQFGASQTFQWARWQLQFFDQFAYLPESNFGFGGGTPLGGSGVPIAQPPPQPGLSGGGQTLFSTVGPRYDNSFATQAIYSVSPRTSINVSGSYGILRFVDAGNIDSNDAGASIGYNYALSKEDTIGLVYRFGRYSYVGEAQTIDDHVINLAYGKKITGRLALSVFGGPDIYRYKVPIGNNTGQTSGSGGAALAYAFSRASVGLNYTHGVTGGSGVFLGSETDQISATAGRRLGRLWEAQGNVGLARNRTLATTASPNTTAYNSYFFGGNVTRPLGPNALLSLGYTVRLQTTNLASGCTGTGCNSTYTQHQLVMSFQWHTRPLVLR